MPGKPKADHLGYQMVIPYPELNCSLGVQWAWENDEDSVTNLDVLDIENGDVLDSIHTSDQFLISEGDDPPGPEYVLSQIVGSLESSDGVGAAYKLNRIPELWLERSLAALRWTTVVRAERTVAHSKVNLRKARFALGTAEPLALASLREAQAKLAAAEAENFKVPAWDLDITPRGYAEYLRRRVRDLTLAVPKARQEAEYAVVVHEADFADREVDLMLARGDWAVAEIEAWGSLLPVDFLPLAATAMGLALPSPDPGEPWTEDQLHTAAYALLGLLAAGHTAAWNAAATHCGDNAKIDMAADAYRRLAAEVTKVTVHYT